MKYFLLYLPALAATTLAQTASTPTPNTAGVTQTVTESFHFDFITATWSYPLELLNPTSEPGVFFYTQYIAIDLFPNTCADFIQVGTNITLDSAENEGLAGTHGGFGFYVWNGVTNQITDANGEVVQFLDGDTVTATIEVSEIVGVTDATVTFNSTSSGVIEIALTGGSLCMLDVEWAIGSALPPDFVDTSFENCEAAEFTQANNNGGGGGGGSSGGAAELITPQGGVLLSLVVEADGHEVIQAAPQAVSGKTITIDFMPGEGGGRPAGGGSPVDD